MPVEPIRPETTIFQIPATQHNLSNAPVAPTMALPKKRGRPPKNIQLETGLPSQMPDFFGKIVNDNQSFNDKLSEMVNAASKEVAKQSEKLVEEINQKDSQSETKCRGSSP